MDPEGGIARSEALYRELNERIAKEAERLRVTDAVEFLCECGRKDCTSPVFLFLDEYREVRSDPERFVVSPGHSSESIEIVVVQTERYEVVRKRGPATGEAG